MKNKTLLYTLIFIVLAAVAVWMVLSDSKSMLKEQDVAFFVTDTASIDQLFFADRKGFKSTLKRVNGQWVVNNKYLVREDAMKTMLSTLYRMRVKNPVPRSAYDGVIRDLSTMGVKTEIYMKGQKVRTFYVGNFTPDMTGTFMKLEESELPYVVYIPGFNGYLSPRFFADEQLWRDNSIMRLTPEAIKSIEVAWIDTSEYNFSVQLSPQGALLYNNTKQLVNHPNPARLKQFVQQFRWIPVEGFDRPGPISKKVLASKPKLTLKVVEQSGKTTTVSVFAKKQLYHPQTSEPSPYDDLERDFFYVKETGDFGTIQRIAGDKIFLKASDLIQN